MLATSLTLQNKFIYTNTYSVNTSITYSYIHNVKNVASVTLEGQNETCVHIYCTYTQCSCDSTCAHKMH